MPRVPQYEPNVSLRPAFRQGVDVRASPEAFGAGIGRGMQQAAEGVGNLGASVQHVRDLEDVTRAKEADNKYAGWLRERQYGKGGFMTLEGKNAVDGRATFEREAEEKRKEFGKGLTPGAAQAYQRASTARIQSTLQQSIVHTAKARKSWFKDASASRVETFANDALVNFDKPALVTKNMAAGIAEMRETGALQGWDADTLKLHESEFVSGVHKNITLRMAQDDPLAADAYMKKHADQMTGADQYALAKSLKTEIQSEQSKRLADTALSTGRSASAPDPVAGRSIAAPTRAKAFLSSVSSHKDRPNDTLGLDDGFASNLAAMIQDAPPEIRKGLGIYSGYRSPERQKELWAAALKKYGSPSAARKWVAPPGRSNHNHGEAVDLAYNGRSLSHAPKEVVDWVHQNAGMYGMYFPLANENWHIEPRGTRGTVAPRNNNVASRSAGPSYDDIEAVLAKEADPDVRDMARKRIYASLKMQSKADKANEDAAKAELWKYVDQEMTPDQVPMEVRQAAGMAAVSSAWNYIETAAKGREIESDQTLLYDMTRYAATNPTEFAEFDLNEYRDRLSKKDIADLTGKQTGALTDQRKAREEGLNLTAAFSQANSQLAAVGITATGKEGSEREEASKRVAVFQNALALQMDEFKRAHDDRAPTQVDIQSMINRLLLPVVVKEPGMLWGTNDRDGFLFEAGERPDGSTVDVVVKYEDIPIDLRRGIALDLERELGRKPSEEEVVQRYEGFALKQ